MGLSDRKVKKQYSNRLRKFLGYRPRNLELYRMALRHQSAAERVKPQLDHKNSNERLEYRGEAALDLVVADMVFNKFPFKGGGYLTSFV